MGGAYAAGGELTAGSLNLAGRLLGLYPEACGPTTGPDGIEGMVFWGGWAWGLKPEASDPTTGADAENGVVVGGGAAAKGEAVIGKFGRPGFSVPMVFNKTTLSARDDYASIAKPKSSSSLIARGSVLGNRARFKHQIRDAREREVEKVKEK